MDNLKLLLQKLQTILLSAVDGIATHVGLLSTPRGMFVSAIAVLTALDIVFLGHIGTLNFFFETARTAIAIVKDLGWQLGLVIVLAVALLRK